MEIDVAIKLVEKGVEKNGSAQVWADLGAGKGLFTTAVSSLLHSGSLLYAVDKDAAALRQIVGVPSVQIKKIELDFISEAIVMPPLDGILIANALHYVPDASTFLRGLKHKLKSSGRVIIIEYDRTTANPWIPYPVSFNRLKGLVAEAGFVSITKIGETPSAFNDTPIYSALIT